MRTYETITAKNINEIELLTNIECYQSAIMRLYTSVVHDLILKCKRIHREDEDNNLFIGAILKDLDSTEFNDEVKFNSLEIRLITELFKNNRISRDLYNRTFDNLRYQRNRISHISFKDEDDFVISKFDVLAHLEFYKKNLFDVSYLSLSGKPNSLLTMILESTEYISSHDLASTHTTKMIAYERDINAFCDHITDSTICKYIDTLFTLSILKDDEECIKNRKHCMHALQTILKKFRLDNIQYAKFKLNENIESLTSSFYFNTNQPDYTLKLSYILTLIDEGFYELEKNQPSMVQLTDIVKKDFSLCCAFYKVVEIPEEELINTISVTLSTHTNSFNMTERPTLSKNEVIKTISNTINSKRWANDLIEKVLSKIVSITLSFNSYDYYEVLSTILLENINVFDKEKFRSILDDLVKNRQFTGRGGFDADFKRFSDHLCEIGYELVVCENDSGEKECKIEPISSGHMIEIDC